MSLTQTYLSMFTGPLYMLASIISLVPYLAYLSQWLFIKHSVYLHQRSILYRSEVGCVFHFSSATPECVFSKQQMRCAAVTLVIYAPLCEEVQSSRVIYKAKILLCKCACNNTYSSSNLMDFLHRFCIWLFFKEHILSNLWNANELRRWEM